MHGSKVERLWNKDQGTPVKELPSSIECLFGRIRIELKNCKRLASLPTSISVKELPSSIGNLTWHKKLDLRHCKNLEFVPKSIYNLNRLITLRFDEIASLLSRFALFGSIKPQLLQYITDPSFA
ncbi:unnamed protein product [Prunus armeniaca]